MKLDFILKQVETKVQWLEASQDLIISTYFNGEHTSVKHIPAPPPPRRQTTAHVTVYPNMVKVKVGSMYPPHLMNIKRGAVGLEFSGKMRKRFLDRLNAWHVPAENMVFAHLTYPNEYDQDWHTWKLHLKVFKRHLQKRFPNAEGFWKLELQRRGAPHFHIILDLRCKCSIRRFRQWMDAVWARIAHDLDQYGGKYACRAETIWSIRHVRNYAAKYMSKPSYSPVNEDGEVLDSIGMRDTMGRLWGRVGRPNCEHDEEFSIDYQSVTWHRLQLAKELKRRQARGWKRLVCSKSSGSFTVYGVGSVSDDRYKTASQLWEQYNEDWFNLAGSLQDELFRLDRVIMGQDAYRVVKCGQNCRGSGAIRVGRGGGLYHKCRELG